MLLIPLVSDIICDYYQSSKHGFGSIFPGPSNIFDFYIFIYICIELLNPV